MADFDATRELMRECDAPLCRTCGAPIETGAMAVFCPRRERCEFWPDDEEGVAMILWLKGERDSPFAEVENNAR